MTKIYLSILIGFMLVACSNIQEPENRSNNRNSIFCSNELELISAFDIPPLSSIRFYYAHDSIDVITTQLFDSSNCCYYNYFNLPFSIDSSHFINVTANTFHDYGNCPIPIRLVDYHFILMNVRSQLLVEDQFLLIDSLSKSVTEYFVRIDTMYEGSLKQRAQIAFMWDGGVDESKWQKATIEILNGYIRFAELKSKEMFKKEVCELDQVELGELATVVPLKLLIERKIAPPKK